MKSTILIAQNYGPAEVLEFYTQQLPELQIGYARIEVKAAGINPIDARRMTGEFRHGSLPQTFGTEFAGVITEISPNSEWSVGDAVLGSGGSFTHATVIDVPVQNLIRKPENVSWEIAGSLAGVAQTAMTILDEIGSVDSLLVHGASGGVGSITIQLAVEKGIKVLATASAKNQEYIESLGAIPFIYGDSLISQVKSEYNEPIDASIDMSGTEAALQASLELVKPNGFIGSIAGKQLSSSRVKPVWVKRNVNNLKYVVDGVSQGKFQWEINQTYPFTEAAKAYTNVLTGHSRGKTVLIF